MLILRPLLILLLWIIGLLFGIRTFRHTNQEADWRFAALVVFVSFGVLVWLMSELLGALHQLSIIGVATLWTSIILFLLIYLWRNQISLFGNLTLASFTDLGNIRRHLSRSSLLPTLFLVLVIGLLGLIAFASSPNNWDSMTYHLSRVMHWQQNQSISFYPTHILRQLHTGPWVEIAILQFQILAGNDRLANFVQLFAMIGSLLGVSYLTKLLGGSRKTQIFALFFAITIPMGILQSTSTQTDYVVSLWVICFVVFLFYLKDEDDSFLYSALTGASLGVAILTKITAVIFATPFAILIGVQLIHKMGRGAWKRIFVIALTAFLINFGHFTRNLSLYGSPLGPMSESPDSTRNRYTNDIYNAPVLVSNLLRNSALHLGTPIETFNVSIEEFLSKVHDWLGYDINDERITWTDTEFNVEFSIHEDNAGNILHLALFMFSLILLFRFRSTKVVSFGSGVVAGFFIFCFLLKWQPWNSRLLLPLFILCAPFTAMILWNSLSHRSITLIMTLLAISSIPYIFVNNSRPLIGPNNVLFKDRISQYFTNNPKIEPSYSAAADTINNLDCSQIGLVLNGDDWEYPFWIMTGASNGSIRLEHIGVDNISGKLNLDFSPCAFVDTRSEKDREITYLGNTFVRIFDVEPVSVFLSTDFDK